MPLERQTAFGWLPSIDIFLGGVGGGVFLASFGLFLLRIYEPLAIIGALLGPILVLVGIMFLAADLSRKSKFYRLFSNPSSWISRGSWILAAFIVFGLAYSLPFFTVFVWLPWSKATILGQTIGVVAAICAVLAITYSGFVFAVVKRVPFWNTPALPPLFFLSSLCTGVALLLIIAPFFAGALRGETVMALHTLMIAEVVLILIQLLVLASHLVIASHMDVSAKESVGLLITPLFIVGVVIAGIVVPLGLLFWGAGTSDISILSWLAGTAGILLLVAGVFLRYAIIRVGVYLPLYSI